MTHVLQSDIWKEFQEALGKTTITRSGEGWHYLALVERGKINTRIYTPYGPIANSPAAFTEAVASLTEEAKKHDATFIRIEPLQAVTEKELTTLGFLRAHKIQPEATSIVALDKPEDELIAHMAASNRNLYRTYAKKGIAIQSTSDPAAITTLTSLLHDVAASTGMRPQSDTYLSAQAGVFLQAGAGKIYTATFAGNPIAAALVYDYAGTRYYAHAASTYEHRKLGAGTAIVSKICIDAKKDGLEYFDLYGIWPNATPGTSQYGITKFKRSYGGTDTIYNGTWELPVRPLNYKFYTLLAKLLRRTL